MATPDQNAALQSALARAKEIAAKLAAGAGASGASAASSDSDDSRKRALSEQVAAFNGGEPFSKRAAMDDPNDPKALAMQVAQTLVNRAGLGSMSSGFQEEMSIPNRYVGLVIGRGGEMINKLQVDTTARIQVAPDPVPDSSGNVPDRQLTITGTPEAVSKAKSVITRIVNDGKVPDSMNMTPGEFVIEHMIPSQKIGLVIGKGGETIRGLQERAGCKMVLIQDGQFSERDEKPLRISGDPDKCQFGKQLVIDLLTAKEIESKQNDVNPDRANMDGTITTEHLVPKEAVGFVIGKSGETIKTIQNKAECKVQFKNDMQGSSKAAVLTGTPEQIEVAKALIQEIVDNGNRPRGGPGGQRDDRDGGGFGRGGDGEGGGFSRGGGGGGGDRPSRMPSTPLKPGEKMMDIKVPKNKCGLIIGKGGETIRMISEDCEIAIEMNRTVPEDAPFRVFSMRGFRPKIQHAEEIIRDKIGDRTCCAVEVASGPPENGQSNQFGGPPQQPWACQQPQQPVWGGQPPSGGGDQPWNQQQQPQQQAPWQQPQQPWQQQQQAAAPWQQPQPQQPWQQPQAGQQQPPWQQQQQAQPQWPAAAAQPQPAAAPAAAAPAPAADATAPAAGAGAQPDYTQAWEAYYQQYYQQYGATAATAATSAAATAATATPVQPAAAAAAPQPAAAAAQPDYSKAWEQYYQVHGYPAGYTATLAAGGGGAPAAQTR